MVIQLTEVYKLNKLTEDSNMRDEFSLRDIFVNPEHVVCLREDELYKNLLLENRLMGSLDMRQTFTKLYLNRGQSGIDLTVVGEPSAVQEKLGLGSNKKLLRG
tara:strand:- start:550 stop:858 length:309 start_codon:yes stop_codon:yes gene_type:complete